MGATATYDLDTAHDNDAQAVFERSLEVNKVSYVPQPIVGNVFKSQYNVVY